MISRQQSSFRPKISGLLPLLVLGANTLLPLGIALTCWEGLVDDAYITFTYARSLAQGLGFVFNTSPPTYGTTTPLQTLILALLSWLAPGVETARIATLFSGACWAAIPWAIYGFRRELRLEAWQALVIGTLLNTTGRVELLGMETYLFALLLVASVGLFLRGWWLAAGAACGFLFLTRGEGALVLAMLCGLRFLGGLRTSGRIDLPLLRSCAWLAAGFLVPVLLWFGYAQATFGQVLPSTLQAKRIQLETEPLLIRFTPRLVLEWGWWQGQFALPRMPLNPFWPLAGLGAAFLVVRRQRSLLFVLWMLVYSAAYWALGIAAYWWYLYPILFVLQILAGFGLVTLCELSGRVRWRGLLRPAAAAGVVVFLLMLAWRKVDWARVYTGDDRASTYRQVARWIDKEAAPGASVAFTEVGYLGYYSKRPIVDLSGLVTPDALPHLRTEGHSWAFWRYSPDYLVYRERFDWALRGIVWDYRFISRYRLAAVFPGPYPEEKTRIFRRIGPPSSGTGGADAPSTPQPATGGTAPAPRWRRR